MNQVRAILAAMAIFRIVDAIAGTTSDRQQLVNAVRKQIAALIYRGRLPKSFLELSDDFISGILDQHPGVDGASDFGLEPVELKPVKKASKKSSAKSPNI